MDFAGMKRRELQALCKRHGLPAGGSNAGLVARLDAALSGAAGAEEEEVVVGVAARKGCVKRSGGYYGEAKKVTFALEEEAEARGRRLRSQVICSPVVAKTRGRRKAGKTIPSGSPAAEASGRGRQRKRGEVGGDSADEGVAAEADAGAPARRSMRSSVSAAEAEEVGEAVAVDRKRKRKSQENAENVAVSAQVGVSCRVTRRSSLWGAAVLLPPVVEKKRGRGKAADGKNEPVIEAQDLAAAVSPAIFESKRSRRKGEDCEPAVQNSAKVEVSGRTTTSRSVAAAAMSPAVIENKRRKTEDAQPDAELRTVSNVPRNDAPVTRALRNRIFQVNNSVEEAHIGKKLENEMQPSRPSTRRYQQVASSVEEEDREQVAAPSKGRPLRRSGRNNSEGSNANSDTNKSSSAPVEVKDLNIAQPLTHYDAKDEDPEKLQSVREPVRRSTRKSVVSAMLEKEEKDLIAEKNPEAHVRRSMRKSVVPIKDTKGVDREIQNAKGDAVAKHPAIKESVRRSTCKSVISVMHEKEKEDFIAEHVRRSTRKSVVPVKDTKGVDEAIQNAKGDDVAKHPAIKESVRRSTCKSVVSVMHEKEKEDFIAEKNPEAHVRRSTRKSVVPVKDTKGVDEEIQNAKGDHVAKQIAIKEPVRRSTRKSVISVTHEKEKDPIAEKNPEALVRRSMWKSVVPIKDIKGAGEETQNAKGEDMKKQLVVKQPVRRSSRKSVLPDMLENDSGFLVAETNAKAHVRRSMRNSVLANMLNKEIQDCNRMARNEDFQSGKCEDEEKQLKLKEPVRRSRRSVATVVLEEQNKGLNEEKKSEIPMRSTRKSIALNLVEKGNMDHTETVGRELSGVGTRKLKARVQLTDCAVATSENKLQVELSVHNNQGLQRSTHKSSSHNLSDDNKAHPGQNKCISCERAGEEGLEFRKRKRSSMEISSLANDSWNTEDFGGHKFRKQQNAQTPNEKDNTGANHEKPLRAQQVSNSTTLKGRPADRGCTIGPEEVMSVEEPKSDDIQTDGSHLFNTRNGELDQSSSIAELVPYTGIVSEDETLMDEGKVNMGAKAMQIVNDGSCKVGLEALNKPVGIAQEYRSTNAVLILEAEAPIDEGYTVNAEKIKQLDEEVASPILSCCDDTTITVTQPQFARQKDSQDVPPIDFTVGDQEEQSPVAGHGIVGGEANTSESTGLNTTGPQQGVNILANETGKGTMASILYPELATDLEDAVPIDITIEEHGEQDLVSPVAVKNKVSGEASASESAGKTLAGIISTGLHTKDLQHDCDVLTKETGEVLNAAKGCSSDGRHLSFGLKFLFPEECKESYSRNGENTVLDVDCGNKPNACVIPSFYVGSEYGLEDEDVQPIGYAANKKLDADQGVAQEEVVDEEKSNDEHVAANNDLKTKLNDEPVGLYIESDCSIAEKNARLVSDNPDDKQAMVQVQQGDVQEGDLENPSLCLATPECKHECGLPAEAVLHSVKNKGCLLSSAQAPFGLQSLLSQESIEESMEYGALASATAHTENGVDELDACHVKCALEKTPVSESVSHHDTHEDSCLLFKSDDYAYTSQKDNGTEGLLKASHDEARVSSSLPGFLVDANHIKYVINSEEVACKGEESRKLVHSEDLNASCEKSDVNISADNPYGISAAVLSSSLHGPANDNGDVRLGSTLVQLESTGFLDETIGCSNIEVLHQGHKDRCNEDRKERVASKPSINDIIDSATSKYIESGVELLPAEERSNLQDGKLSSKLESAKVVESALNFNNDVINIVHNGSVVGIVGKRTPSVSSLPKDSSTDHYLQQELLDGFSVETSLEGSTTFGEKIVSRLGTAGNPSFSLATHDCKHEGALSEDAVRIMKNYAATCSSNPRELLMELQSLFSKESIEESDPHNVPFPSVESRGDESIDVEQQVKVHIGVNLTQLESTNLLDEMIGCSNTEVLHQGNKDCFNEDREEQFFSGPCTNDIMEAATDKYIESGVVLLPSEERSNLKGGQLNPKLEGPTFKESGLSCNKDISKTSDHGSFAGIVGKRTPSGSGLPKDSPTDPPCDVVEAALATPDYKHEGAWSEEAVHTMKNYAGTCASDSRQLLMELQSLFSKGSIEKSDPHDGLAFPSAESGGDEPIVFHVEKLVDTLVSSEPDTYQGPRQDLSRAEEKEGCMSVFMQENEREGFLNSSQFDLSDVAHHIERDIIAEEVLCEEKEKRKSMPTSDSDILHEKSPSNGYGVLDQHHKEEYHDHDEDRVTSGIHATSEAATIKGFKSGIALVQAAETSTLVDEQLNPELEGNKVEKNSFSCEKCTSNILGTGHEESKENNVEQKTPGIPASSMSEAAEIGRSERDIVLTPAAGISALPDEQLNTKLEGNRVDEHSCSYDKDTSCLFDTKSTNTKASNLHKNVHMDPSGEHNHPNDLSALRCPEESTVFQNDYVLGPVGICQSSRRRGIDEISTKLRTFKVSSTVKGSYIAMSAPRPKQGDNLSQSAIALLRNRENTPGIKVDHPVDPNPDRLVAKDSSRRALQPISGRPGDP